MKYVKFEVVNQIKKNLDYYLSFFTDANYELKIEKEFSRDYYDQNEVLYQLINYNMSVQETREKKKTDFDNAVLIYENYKYLTESQASDERFWVGISLEKNNMSYLFYRWGKTKETIKYRLTYHIPGKRGMVYHGLARLWWFAHLTYQNESENPYELTEFAFSHPHILEKMIYRNFSNSKTVRTSIIKAIKKYIIDGGLYTTTLIDGLYKYVSLIGGNKLLDLIPENVLMNELVKFLSNS